MDPKRSGVGGGSGGSGVKVLSILDRPLGKRTGTSEVRVFSRLNETDEDQSIE